MRTTVLQNKIEMTVSAHISTKFCSLRISKIKHITDTEKLTSVYNIPYIVHILKRQIHINQINIFFFCKQKKSA